MNSGHRSSAIGLLPLGNITVEVHISDSLGASAIQRRQVQVIKSLSDVDSKENRITAKNPMIMILRVFGNML